AIEHRLMHAETLAYMFHQLPLEKKVAPSPNPHASVTPLIPSMIEIPAGPATLGLSRASGKFGWDNEFDEHTVTVPPFTIDRYKVTNGQFLEFMHAGGYENRSLWNDDDWRWKVSCNITHPVFWRQNGNNWLLRTMFQEIALPPTWPVF